MSRLALSIVFLTMGLGLHAQFLTLSTDRASILLGEQFKLEVKLTAPIGSKITRWPAVADSVNHLEVIDRSAIDSVRQGDKMQYIQQITMTGFDSGRWVIPALKAEVEGKEIGSATATIDVQNIKLEGSEYNDIKEIIEVEPPGPDWKKIALYVFGVLLILALAYYWWKNRKAKPAKPLVVNRGTAYEEAMRQMNILKKEQLAEKGEVKKYYSRLYDIYRMYIQGITGRNAMQFTTDDLLLQMKGELNGQVFTGMAEALRVSDAVKFAKYKPSQEEALKSMEQVRESIEALNRQKQ